MTDQSYAFQNRVCTSEYHLFLRILYSCVFCSTVFAIKTFLLVLSRDGFSPNSVCSSALTYGKNASLICFDLLHVNCSDLIHTAEIDLCVCLCVWTILRLAYVLSGGSQQAAFNQKCLSLFNITFMPGLTPVPISLLPQHSSQLTHQITFCFPNKSSKGPEKVGELAFVIFSEKSSWIGHGFFSELRKELLLLLKCLW